MHFSFVSSSKYFSSCQLKYCLGCYKTQDLKLWRMSYVRIKHAFNFFNWVNLFLFYFIYWMKESWNSTVLYNFQVSHMISNNLIIILFLFLSPSIALQPYLSPLIITNWFSLSVSMLLFVLFIILLYFLHSTDKCYHTVFVLLWLISHSVMPLKSIHVAANGKISFFFTAE